MSGQWWVGDMDGAGDDADGFDADGLDGFDDDGLGTGDTIGPGDTIGLDAEWVDVDDPVGGYPGDVDPLEPFGGADTGPDDEPLGYADDGPDDGRVDPAAEAGGVSFPPLGSDPDLVDDDGWLPVFPEPVVVPDLLPVDGFPWADPGLLGDADPAGGSGVGEGWPGPPPEDLVADAAVEPPSGDPWAALAGSDDPAVSALARWWAPGPS